MTTEQASWKRAHDAYWLHRWQCADCYEVRACATGSTLYKLKEQARQEVLRKAVQ